MSAALAVSLVATVISAGVSAYSSYESGKAQKAIAFANATEMERQAKSNMATLKAQADMQAAQAEINYKLRAAEAKAKGDNAKNLEAQAQQQTLITRSNLRKRQEEFAVAQATQRATIAASGAVEASGTPLDMVAEMASQIQKDASEQQFGIENTRRTIFREADLERLGGELALQGATLDKSSGLLQAAFTEASGKAQYLAGMREAEISRLKGRAAKRAGTLSAVGTIFGGISDAVGIGYDGGMFGKKS